MTAGSGEGRYVLRRHRVAVEEALAVVAVEAPKEAVLLLGLDALGGDTQLETLAQGDDGPQQLDLFQPRVGAQAAHEAAVDLEAVKGQTAQLGQGGVSYAEVVEGHVDAHGAHLAELARSRVQRLL